MRYALGVLVFNESMEGTCNILSNKLQWTLTKATKKSLSHDESILKRKAKYKPPTSGPFIVYLFTETTVAYYFLLFLVMSHNL